jgi:hypothetical protein
VPKFCLRHKIETFESHEAAIVRHDIIRRGASYVRRPLYEDLAVLFGAEHLMIARGTFGVAVAMLSIHVKAFYTFNMSSSACGGHYNCWPDRAYWRGIMQGWDHTPEELALMLKHGCEKWTWIQPGTDDFGEMHPHME